MASQLMTDAIRLRRCEDSELFERYRRDRDPADRELLVERFRALALHLSRRYHSRGERDDLEQIACLALLKAIDRYDPAKGVAFSSFAVPTIIGELKRYFRDCGWSVRVPRSLQELNLRITAATEQMAPVLGRAPTVEELAERCETTPEHVVEALSLGSAHRADSLDAPTGTDDDRQPRMATIPYDESGYAEAERAADVERLLRCLPRREQAIVHMRFHNDLTQREIADRIGLSQMHVSRLLRAALDDLRRLAEAEDRAAA
jgi:RNA polymerase sigma-B factor